MLLLLRRYFSHGSVLCKKRLYCAAYQHLIFNRNQSTVKMKPGLLAVTQMTAVQDKETNLKTCIDLVQRAAAVGAKMVFLPEACDYIAESKEASLQLAEPIHGPQVTRYRELAASSSVWLSLGGIHIKEEGDEKISNTHIIINDKGDIVSTYTKGHLFSVHIPEKKLHLEESNYATRGQAINPPVSTPVGEVALGICYDMRFPEMSMIQRKLGAEILTFPSAFTVTTGLAHWEALLRARAIESQCYVIAAAQTGQHNSKRSSYGHAMIVDPWGAVIGQASEGTCFFLAEINLDYLQKVRKEMPVLIHRRHDLYNLEQVTPPHTPHVCQLLPQPSPYVTYKFGQVSVPGSCVFLKSRLSQAFVNKKPVVPGHTLITPEKPSKRLADLLPAEVSDVAQMTQKALKILLKAYNPTSYQIGIQDGPSAGQTIDHLHMHLLPMTPGSIEKLQGHEQDMSIRWRETSEMEEEATRLRNVAADIHSSLSIPVDTPKCLKLQKPVLPDSSAINIPPELLVVKTELSCAYFAPHPVLPGHVCVSLQDKCRDFSEANCNQLTDLLLTVQLVQKSVESNFGVDSSTVMYISGKNQSGDGELLRFHIIPRCKGDLPRNDDIYTAIHNYCHSSLKPDATEELKSQAEQLRKKLYEAN